MKRFKSVSRAIKRGHVKFVYDDTFKRFKFIRKVRNNKWIDYTHH